MESSSTSMANIIQFLYKFMLLLFQLHKRNWVVLNLTPDNVFIDTISWDVYIYNFFATQKVHSTVEVFEPDLLYSHPDLLK